MKRYLLTLLGIILCLTMPLLAGCTNKENELIAQTIAQIEQEPSWQKRVDIYKDAELDNSTKQNEVKPALRASIEKDCSGLEDFLNRPDRKETWEIYREYGPRGPILSFRGRLGERPINEILTSMSDLLAFYQEIGIAYEPLTEVNYYSFPRYDFNEEVKMLPEINDYEEAEAIEHNGQYKYIVLYQNRNKDIQLMSTPMLRFLSSEEMPKSIDDIDMVIVVADFPAGGAVTYEDGGAAVGLRTNICVYDYRTGELLGVIDTIYQGARGWTSTTKGGMPDFPEREVNRAVGTFFNFY